MKITALGTNGWFDSQTGNTICTLIQTGSENIILDAGFGIAKIKKLLDFSLPTWLFLSHLHLDHTIGLHTLDWYKFEKPLLVVAPAGQKADLLNQMRPPYTSEITRAPYPTEIKELEEYDQSAWPFTAFSLPLIHAVPDSGYRFVINGKVIAYLCDTGYCENAVALAKDADLVISECGALPGKAEPGWPHFDPLLAAKMALDANAKKVLLTHFGAGEYDTIDKRIKAVEIGRAIYPNLITGIDLLELVL